MFKSTTNKSYFSRKHIRADGSYRKLVHDYRRFWKFGEAAWGVDVQVLAECWNAGVRQFEFKNEDDGLVYRVSLQNFYERGRRLDAGFGTQMFLCFSEFDEIVQEEPVLPKPKKEKKAKVIKPAKPKKSYLQPFLIGSGQ